MDRITRIVFLIALFATFGMADVGNTNAAPSTEGSEFIVLVGTEEGQEALVYCLEGQIKFWVQLYPFGGGMVDVAPDGVSCDDASLDFFFPRSEKDTFDDPTEGWKVAPGSEEGQLAATRCIFFTGSLITVTPTIHMWPSVIEERNSPACNPAT